MKNIKSIMLDTTYVLPLFGIKINLSENFQEELSQLWKNGIKDYDIYLPSTCLIETVYKLLYEYRKRDDLSILERYHLILPTILNSSIQIYNPELDIKASAIASIIRHSGHLDYKDCWIAGSAVALNSILLTEDKELEKILKIIPETKSLNVSTWKKFITKIFNEYKLP